MSTSITFNSYDLQDANIVTSKAEHTQFPNRRLDIQNRVRDDGFELTGDFFLNKRIVVEGNLIDTSNSNLRSRIDTMKKNLVGEEKNLDIGYGSGTRRYIATVESLEIPEEYYNVTIIKYRVVFLCRWYGRDVDSTTTSTLNITASPSLHDANISGSASARPIITVTVDSETDMTVIAFKNDTTNEEITITRSFAAGEVLVIDTNECTVKVDNVEVDFTGEFPNFLPGVNGWRLTTTDSGAFQSDVSITYHAYYL